jgi:predicted nucleotidyltransferase
MDRETVSARLRQHRAELERLGVQSLELFGSVARDEAGPDSDVDILVAFSRPVGLFHFITTKEFLESILGQDVDLVTRNALKPQLRERILEEAVDAAWR